MTADLSSFLDFMEESDGFESPLMPSKLHPEGKSYRVPSPDALTGLRLNALADITLKQSRGTPVSENDVKRLRIDDADEREFISQVLSVELVDEMLVDGVRWEHMKRLSMYAFTYFAVSREAANTAADNGLFAGKELAPTNRAGRRKSPKKTAGGSRGMKSTTSGNSRSETSSDGGNSSSSTSKKSMESI